MEFAATREVFASLYDQTPDATILCDLQERIIAANAAARRLFGLNAQESGKPCTELTADAQRLSHALRRAGGGEGVHCGVELLSAEGSKIASECDLFPARICGEIVGAFLQVRSTGSVLRDPLTGLPSGALLEDRIEQNLVAALRYSYRFALIHADLDGFSQVNARFGASAADEVLRAVAQRMREVLRKSDTVARVRADEFVVLQPMIENVEDAVDLAHKVIFSMSAPVALGTTSMDVRLSLGIAIYPDDGESSSALAAAANRALRDAKRHARGLFQLAKSLETERAG